MPQVILHVCCSMPEPAKSDLVRSVREVIPRVLGVPAHTGQVVLYETDTAHRGVHASRDPRFVIFEAMMYPGRTKELKTVLMQEITSLIAKYAGVKESDVLGIVQEIPPEHYYGGTSRAFVGGQGDPIERKA